jgi:hypothetical protein
VPTLSKHVLTRYLGSDCTKQLRLLMATRSEQMTLGMPPKQPPRPGLQQIAAAGDEWAAEKLAELDTALGTTVLVGQRRPPLPGGGVAFSETPLAPLHLAAATPGTFLAEFEYPVGATFEAAYGTGALITTHGLVLSSLRPDLIEVRPAASGNYEEALPDGKVRMVSGGDGRRRLRVIDIKLTSQPGPGYLAEVVYYSIALAGWLVDKGLNDQYAVCADPAIWPGSHTASAISQARAAAAAAGASLPAQAFLDALASELVLFPYEVFAARLRHFFTSELPEVLSQPWNGLPYHVGTKCRGCDFLGQDWGPSNPGDSSHCLPTATATDHLSRIPFVSRGALDLLTQNGAPRVADVAALPPTDQVFSKHHSLRGQRTVLAGRAVALAPGGVATIPSLAGTSATIPSWADLRVYVTADFDASSALTLAFGLKAWWREPSVFGAPPPTGNRVWQARTFAVDNRSLAAEEMQLLNFLGAVDDILRDVKTEDTRLNKTSTAQFYVWDDLTYRHLTRVVGRHLTAVLAHPSGMRYLAWLFPPEEVMGTAELIQDPVVSVVGSAVKNLLALPVPHHYSLLATARAYHRSSMTPPWDEFRVPPLFEDPLSDQIPSERAHAIWTKAGGRYPWATQAADLTRTVSVRLNALEEVAAKLGEDLRGQLVRRAPKIASIAPPTSVNRLTSDELLIYAFHKLNDAYQRNKAAQIRAMPPHQREAVFASARLTRRLDGSERTAALAVLGATAGLNDLVYEIRPGSEDAKIEEGDFLMALVPETRTEILDWTVGRLANTAGGAGSAAVFGGDQYVKMSKVLQVTVTRFDRVNRLALLEWDSWNQLARDAVLGAGLLDVDHNVSLEKVPNDFLGPRLKATLQAIGRTPKAMPPPVAATALGLPAGRGPRPTPRVPVEDLLWDALAMSTQPVMRPGIAAARAATAASGLTLNPSQWAAWDHALSHRLTLLWGPPGTGKSRTLTSIVVGAALEAANSGVPLRVLISASTWSAVDNVLGGVAARLAVLLPTASVYRLQTDDPVPNVQNVKGDRTLNPETQPIADRLTAPTTEITVVGSSSQQLNKFAQATGSAAAPLFDLIICDEASQTDMANAVLPLATLAEEGSVVVAGDPLQLAPIKQVDAPVGTEYLVGSVYEYLAELHHVPRQALEENYRSNKEIVALAHQAKYLPSLHAYSPDLRLDLVTPLPTGPVPPPGWPADLAWSATLTTLLDPATPVVCVVHPDVLSGQSSDFEAQLVAGLTWLLHGRLGHGLLNERHPMTGAMLAPSGVPYSVQGLVRDGVGVVTPHRAQISKIVTALAGVLPGASAAELRGAVDTVERYQGQQRDVIIASFAVGDPDTVSDEDEFLQSLNRFNVMASRARAKLIVLMSESLVQHLPSDLAVLRGSALLKSFAETFCATRTLVDVNWLDPDTPPGTVTNLAVSLRVP